VDSSEHTILKVFVGEDGAGGNPLGVFLDGASVPRSERQQIATELGYSETVFVDDRERGEVAIYTPATELPFAGHPLVGTAWLLAQHGAPVRTVRPPAGEVGVSYEDELTFIAADPSWTIQFEYVEYGSPAEVDALDGAPDGLGFAYCWAWIDEDSGTVRTRSFVPAEGIAEDEATGSAALTLSGKLGRSLEIHQGVGSLIHTRYHDASRVEAGGRVERA
jgi:predicted PhzF superfamily epimerase YddE/YHI9